MPEFISFAEFSDILGHGSGILLFVLTAECDGAGRRLGRRLQRAVGESVAVHLMCADVTESPTLVFYEGGDSRPLLTREGVESVRSVSDTLAEAARRAASRPSAAEEAKQHAEVDAARTERMLASERLDHFPPFFQMARTLARDAWHAARRAGEGSPLLLPSEAAAARLRVCETCPSLRGDRCVECGCYMTIKAHLAAMQCPLGKWPAAD